MHEKRSILTFAVLVVHFCIFHACEKYSFVREDDAELKDHVIKTMTTPFVEICWDKCVWIMNCFSINVRMNSFGMVECDLNNSSKKASPGSLVPRQGSQYHEHGDIKGCYNYECKRKESLGDEWYRLGDVAVKLFIENKTWIDARTKCQSLGGDLLSISTSYENDFISDALLKTIDLPERFLPGLVNYWALDGQDTDVILKGDQGAASYEIIGGEKAIYLNGNGSYAELPAVVFNPEGFTFMLWVKPMKPISTRYTGIYGDWQTSTTFILYMNDLDDKNVSFIMHTQDRGSVHLKSMSIQMNKWNHIAVSWNKTEKSANIVFNGQHESKKQGSPGSSTSIKKSSNAHYQLGIINSKYVFGERPFKGYMKHLMVFDRTLNKEEIQTAMHWSTPMAWIGIYAKNHTNTFKWSDGTEVQFMALPSDLPSESARKCVALKNSGTWFDRQCQEKRPFICEKPIP